MKTIKELFEEILTSKELQEELRATSLETLPAFLKNHDCDADPKEFIAFWNAQAEGEIDDADAASATGGIAPPSYLQEFKKVPTVAPL